MDAHAIKVKLESFDPAPITTTTDTVFIDLTSDSDDDQPNNTSRPRVSGELTNSSSSTASIAPLIRKQFWKAGDYEGRPSNSNWCVTSDGMEHLRVHPKFLHSNATSHKWALGAFAELLDNALDEVRNGATCVNIDMVESNKCGKMLLIEDNGGGMDPDKMRQCMSLGYSAKSKLADTIGQYGNGFKTSTMRLGADVIVFSRCRGERGERPTQSIGLLSYTFLTSTCKEDIVVPMLDYEREGSDWKKMMRSTSDDWNLNLNTIVQWSPFFSEKDLLRQFTLMTDHGTRIIIYNLWEDDQGLLELDFEADKHDIQIRGVNRDEKSIQTANRYPNSRHFLTYHHSLRSYVSILYLRIPPGFRIILRGQDVVHHNIVNDMMMREEVTYRPQQGTEGFSCSVDMVAIVTIGFVKDAASHIDVQGFNVYHKNRLIKPFWRLWNSAGSDGRGVIGLLEADFVEPAHDKQGFERTTVLAKLEGRLIAMQKTYWRKHCHKIGYAPRHSAQTDEGVPKETSSQQPGQPSVSESTLRMLDQLRKENSTLKERLKKKEDGPISDLRGEVEAEREKGRSLEAELLKGKKKIEDLNKEQESLIDIFSEERDRRDAEMQHLKQKLKHTSKTIQELVDKAAQLETKTPR
uniref:Morc S5 domain-containing protein n=1 Tax=Kalanchoe fedtschenkoi TaxID=63787 RepID=A0A7N1A6U3_KALFE